ncbi:hypothetical protein BDZ94DRAFT_1309405 [Collybia nuda]|uniref:Uncharacterized protein n=1 Tax=Collybia nuda TaxID=64659 RepID=A0A9P6CEB8_9AGAR|nr:hypothetical protein BDZ94DRAFT_1309405 [Collybia nuda]
MLKKMKSMVTLGQPEVKQYLTAKDIERGKTLLLSNVMIGGHKPATYHRSGGATSVIILGNRTSTKDVDFISSRPEEFNEICDAKYEATQELKTYPGDWLNSDMIAYVHGEPDCDKLFENSVNMGEIMYQSDVIVAYVADWRFQLVGKIQRCYMVAQSDGSDTRHLSDAIYILILLVTRNGGPLSIAMIRTWYAIGPLLTMKELTFIDNCYQRHLGVVSGLTA